MFVDRGWNPYRSLQLEMTQPTEAESLCEYAQLFAAWAEQLCRSVEAVQDLVAVNHAKVLLVDRYFEWRASVPKNHRNYRGERSHLCIFTIFERAYQRIKVVQLTLAPILTSYPSPIPAPAPADEIDIGEFMPE